MSAGNETKNHRGEVRELASFHDPRCNALIPTIGGRIIVMNEACRCEGKRLAYEFIRQGGRTT